jgi:hypothetical protein
VSQCRYLAHSLAEYLARPGLERTYTAILFDSEGSGKEFEDPLRTHGESIGLTMFSELVSSNKESLGRTLGDVMKKGFRTIVVNTNSPSLLRNIADVADTLGMLGPSWVWFLSGDALPPQVLQSLENDADSSFDRLLRGAGIWVDYDPFILTPQDDRFLQS